MIEIQNLKKTYDRGTRNAHEVLHGISLTLPDTGFVCILGASGCGKTTLLNAIGGLDTFDSGKMITDEREITRAGSPAMEEERNANFGYIFQNYYLLSEHSVAYNVLLGMHSLPLSHREKMCRVKEALEKVDMFRYRKRSVGQLSGGQQQRVAIARALARNPKVIFADEPTGNLDEANTMNICTILKELSRESLVVMVTHEERIAKFFADRIITLKDGDIDSDTSEWQRGTMDAGEKDAVYTEDYTETTHSEEGLSVRLLTQEGAERVEVTILSEKDRIIIKVNDPRVVLCSEPNASPKLIEGKRPVLSVDSFGTSAPLHPSPAKRETTSKKQKKWFGLRFLYRESKHLSSKKNKAGVGVAIFTILLSLMIALSVTDLMTIANIDPEDFITTDSHMVHFQFRRGVEMDKYDRDLQRYIGEYISYLEASSLEFDYVIPMANQLEYYDDIMPQFDKLSLKISVNNAIDISRLDASSLIEGRMPTRSDEIVIDRWVIDQLLQEDGILQNIIPGSSYFIGKQLSIARQTFAPTVVGICDSGQPAIYMAKETMVALGPSGIEAISLSEFRELTGYSAISELAADECIILANNAGKNYLQMIGSSYTAGNNRYFTIQDALEDTDAGITAKLVVADSVISSIYDKMVLLSDNFGIWCTDKASMKAYLEGGMPEELKGILEVQWFDHYETKYQEQRQAAWEKVDTRLVVTLTVLAFSVVMLYLMHRARRNERMEPVIVYRLLGIPKRNLTCIFSIEILSFTLKYSLPAVLAFWGVTKIIGMIDALEIDLVFDLSTMCITLLSILTVNLLLGVLPILRLLSKPPARLAAKYDF